MTDIFNAQNSTGGQATTSASAAAALPVINSLASSQNGRILYITCDNYLRIAFGASSVVATTNSQLFAPGTIEISVSLSDGFYSTIAPTGTPNYSIVSGNVINISPQGN